MLSAVDRYVIARESNIARRFQPRARSANAVLPWREWPAWWRRCAQVRRYLGPALVTPSALVSQKNSAEKS
jgi:hypothetical protein